MDRFFGAQWVRHTALVCAGLCLPATVYANQSNFKGKIDLLKDGGLFESGASVLVLLKPKRKLPLKPVRVTVEQVRKKFSPDFLVIPKGSEVFFPNNDRIFHNAFSLSRAARFDLGLYKQGENPSVVFKRKGVVDVYCNIHPQMTLKIRVVDTPLYALTDKAGVFSIPKVPHGPYEVEIWERNGATLVEKIVHSSATGSFTRQLEVDAKMKRHLRKDGTPYGRYK